MEYLKPVVGPGASVWWLIWDQNVDMVSPALTAYPEPDTES